MRLFNVPTMHFNRVGHKKLCRWTVLVCGQLGRGKCALLYVCMYICMYVCMYW
jgi:hypothetical protein